VKDYIITTGVSRIEITKKVPAIPREDDGLIEVEVV